MTISSNRIVLALLVTAMSCCATADAATFKIATVTPEGSQWMKDMRAGAAEIKERTEGRVQIKYFGSGIMGNDQKVLGQIRIGRLQGGALTPSALGSRYPDINLYGMPLVFDSEEEAAYVRKRLDERLGAGLEEAGFVTFGFAAGGFANILSNTPVRGLADLKGKRVWVLEGDTISYASMEALSLSPVTLPLTDVLMGLQTGLIDIVAIPPIVALVLQWHTKIKYITELPLAYSLGFMAIDKGAFAKISAEDQAVFCEVMTAIYANLDQQNLVDNRGALDALINSGIKTTVFDPAEIVRIRALLEITNRELGAKGEFTIELYDEMIGYIEEYRSEHP